MESDAPRSTPPPSRSFSKELRPKLRPKAKHYTCPVCYASVTVRDYCDKCKASGAAARHTKAHPDPWGLGIHINPQTGKPKPKARAPKKQRPRKSNNILRSAIVGPLGLTVREKDILKRMAEGGAYQGISEEMQCPLSTVQTAAISVRKKLGATTITQAVAIAIRKSII